MSSDELISAHGIGGREDLPIPLPLAMYAGAIAVLISFFALAALWATPRLHGAAAGRPLSGVERIADSRVTRVALQVLGVLLLAGFLVAAWGGPNDNGVRNPAPTWLYATFWVGLVPLSLLFGPIWRFLNPLRTIAASLRPGAVRVGWTAQLSARIGYWPAVGGLLVFLWMELVYDRPAAPQTVALFVTVYAYVHIAAGAIFGPSWFARGDSFEVYSWLVSCASPWGRREDGRIVLRNPLNSLAATARIPDITPVIVVVLGSTAFDGLSRTTLWSDLTKDAVARSAYLATGTAGLLGCMAIVAGTYGLAIRLTRPFLPPGRDPYTEYAHALVPIAIGYTIAHYFSFAVFQGQQSFLLGNDPLVRGWDLFGFEGQFVNYTFLSDVTIAVIQTAAIIVGHIAAVAASHDRSVALLPAQHSRKGQYPMLTLMVLYTVTGIALIAGA